MKLSFSIISSRVLLFAVFFSSLQSCIYINTNDNIAPRGVQIQTFNLNNFDRLSIGSAFIVSVTKGADFRIQATGELNDLEDLDFSINRSGILEIRYRNSWRRNRDRMDIDIVMPDLRGVDFSGATISTIEGFENIRNLDIVLSGASRSDISGSADNLNLDLSGASQLDLRGSATSMVGDLSGASQLFAFDFPVKDADLGLSGASRARVWASNLLKVDASGGSNVRYKGSPIIDQRLSGGSTITRE